MKTQPHPVGQLDHLLTPPGVRAGPETRGQQTIGPL